MWKNSLLVLMLAWIAGVSVAAERDATDPYSEHRGEIFEFDPTVDDSWKDRGGKVPPLPADSALQEVEMDHLPAGLKLFVDPNGLQVNENDQVSRLWVVLKGKGGAYNARYEGFHCSAFEYKTYAYGNPRRAKPVRETKNAKWYDFSAPLRRTYHQEFSKVVCAGPSPKTPDQFRASLAGRYQEENPFYEFTDNVVE